MYMNAAIAAAILAFTSGASAHMRLLNPAPFAGVDQAPLLDTGANFPCGGHPYTVGTPNNWVAGSTQEISFLGTAVHSGGSCQFAFTDSEAPTAASVWRVVHSVIGGCPKNIEGNVEPGDAEGRVADKFTITIPKDTPNGKLTFAWVWFNKTGNREMYMKCAPIELSGGATDKSKWNTYPEIFKANIGNGCTTIQKENVNFPNPGPSVQNIGPPGNPGYTGNCGGSGGGAPAPAPPAGGAPAPAPPAPAPAPAPAAPAAPAAGGDACGAPGTVACKGEGMYAICNGPNTVFQPVAPGTRCVGGKIEALRRRSLPPTRRHASSVLRRHATHFKA